MKKIYSEEQLVKTLKDVEATGKQAEACRKYGVSDATIYNWRKRYGGLELSDLRKLKTLEDENRRLKMIVADKELDLDALKALLEKYDGARWTETSGRVPCAEQGTLRASGGEAGWGISDGASIQGAVAR